MFRKTSIALAIGMALSAGANAEYRWQLDAGYSAGEIHADAKTAGHSDSKNIDTDIWGGGATWFLKPVDTSKGPLAEAPFIDHSSSLTLYATDGQVDLSNLNNNLNDEDGQEYGAKGRYVAPGEDWQMSGWILDVGYLRSEPGDAEIDSYKLGIGKYLTDTTTLTLNYDKTYVDHGGDTDAYSVDLEHLWLLSHGGIKAYASAGRVRVEEADDIDSYKVGGTYYFTNNLGLGAGYSNTSQNGYEVQGWDVHTQWFINESIALTLAYASEDPDDVKFSNNGTNGKVELDSDLWTVAALVRF